MSIGFLLRRRGFATTLLCMTWVLCPQDVHATDTAISGEVAAIARKEYPTERLYQLWLASRRNPEVAVAFVRSLSEPHISEAIAGDDRHLMLTYFHVASPDTEYVMLSGGPDFYGLRFKRLGETPVFFCTQRVPKEAFFTYGFNVFTRSAATVSGAPARHGMKHVHDGVFTGPAAPLWRGEKAGTAGTLDVIEIDSLHLGMKRKVSVYRPAAVEDSTPANLVIQFDGEQFLADPDAAERWRGWTPMRQIVDSLIAQGAIGPTVVAFVWNEGRRGPDLIRDEMADFVARELLPQLQARYPISRDPSRIVASGPSRAGYTALNTALRHPKSLSGVLSQSGSFYFTLDERENWPVYPEHEGILLPRIMQADVAPLQVHLDVGLYDLGAARLGLNRHLRDILRMKGHSVSYVEYKGGHAHLNWRHTLAQGLIALLGSVGPVAAEDPAAVP